MNIEQMIEVLQAAQRGEEIEFRYIHSSKGWNPNTADAYDFAHYDYRIAPKKEMSLVEELREWSKSSQHFLFSKAADRIEELELEKSYCLKNEKKRIARIEELESQLQETVLTASTDELLAELKRRTS